MRASASSSQRATSCSVLICRGRFHDPSPGANLEDGRAWLRLNEEPVREGAIKITRVGTGAGAGLVDFDGVGDVRELR